MTGSDDRRQDPPVNNGLMISGGTHYVGNQAVGHGAQAFSGSVSFQPQDAERTAELLAYVERLLEEHRAALADPDATSRSCAACARNWTRPNRSRRSCGGPSTASTSSCSR